RPDPDRRRHAGPGHGAAAEDVLRPVRRDHRGSLGLARGGRARPEGPRRADRGDLTGRAPGREPGMEPKTLFDKVWDAHVVLPETDDTPAVLYVDLHLVHEVTSPQAFDVLRARGLPVRRPDLTLATMDHSTPTVPITSLKDLDVVSEPAAARQVRQLEKNCAGFGTERRGFFSGQRGIVHVIGPELGATQPGKTIVCGDSHTSTHGAFGALAFGIGTTEVGHVLATQCLLQRKPKSLAITL